MSPRSWQQRIVDIIESAEKILAAVQGVEFSRFASDALLRDAVLYNVVIIGEAARYIPADVQSRYPEVPWRELREIRNFVAHVYHRVSYRQIWRTITTDLPVMV
ncbi:MAG TPA: DUF86 domain-containing protein, partial [Longimicrobium sp.]|nr:DUF86 domain-containing protein [Longimicrobium sp.]